MTPAIRDDLAEAHRLAWAHLASPGSWWTGAERIELAATAVAAIADPRSLNAGGTARPIDSSDRNHASRHAP